MTRAECHRPGLRTYVLVQTQKIDFSQEQGSPNFGPESPDRKVFRSISECRPSHHIIWPPRGSCAFDEAKPVECIGISVLGFIVHDFPGRDASYLANRDMRSTFRESEILEGLSADCHYR